MEEVMKKSERAAAEARTAELARTASVDEENVLLRLAAAQHAAEIAKWKREAQAERQARLDAEKRLRAVEKKQALIDHLMMRAARGDA